MPRRLFHTVSARIESEAIRRHIHNPPAEKNEEIQSVTVFNKVLFSKSRGKESAPAFLLNESRKYP